MAKNTFKPWHICVALILLILVILALFLPYWVWWDVNGGNILNYVVNPNNNNDNLRVNVGLWQSQFQTTSRGSTTCNAILSLDDCVCTPIKNSFNGALNNANSGTLSNIRAASTAEPKCNTFDVDSCDVDRSLTGTNLVNYEIETKLKCDSTMFARYSKCGAKLDQQGNPIANSAPNCPAGQWDDCMRDWIRATRAMFFISIVLLLIIIAIYAIMPCMQPPSLPMMALVALVLAILNFIVTLLGTIFGAVAFKLGCNNDWDRLSGKVYWHAAMGIAIAATIIAFLFIIVAYFAWTAAKRIRDMWQYNYAWNYGYYGNQYVKAPVVYQAPVQYADYGYDYYNYPAAAAPAYYQGYGASPEADAAADVQYDAQAGTEPAPQPPLFVHPPPE